MTSRSRANCWASAVGVGSGAQLRGTLELSLASWSAEGRFMAVKTKKIVCFLNSVNVLVIFTDGKQLVQQLQAFGSFYLH